MFSIIIEIKLVKIIILKNKYNQKENQMKLFFLLILTVQVLTELFYLFELDLSEGLS